MLAPKEFAADFMNRNAPSALSAWATARIHKRLDSEMAAQLRMLLAGSFQTARSWLELRKGLKQHGFYLCRSGLRLLLCDMHSHVEICSCRFLGFPAAVLEQRLGSLMPQV
ncbi:hypothetical protein KUV26_18155 [Leisingera daeponensis]|uniref:Uncharacterized protein n=1 Tax=Leisingera daeponensis TaxID=405746 RepID=A0ABS7NMI7_9RHOB|nr:hypothetical protein [Leisingera daeponensis]MBY6141366.1 hypothetical protein [Leisingera daeponensis]